MEALPDSLIVLGAHARLQKSADVTYPYRQDSNFWYLTGINEPDIILVVDTKSGKSTLLLPVQNDYQKEWDGAVDAKELIRCSGVDAVDSIEELELILKHAKAHSLQICTLAPSPELVEPYGFYSNPSRRKLYEKIITIEQKPKDIRIELARLRQVKDALEIDAIQEAIAITHNTLNEIKESLRMYKTETDIERAITVGFYKHGGDGHAYEPIIAGGKNASIIHYNKNAAKLPTNGLLLLDVGASFNGYAADISRTWAMGKTSERQKDVFKHVQSLQQKAFQKLKAGVNLREYQKEMEQEAQKVMSKLGVTLDKYPHGFSHFLGLDVHDAGDYEQELPEHALITVEPGIYLPKEGIGVRIEDDVLITKTGIQVLSEDIPRDL